MRLFIAEKPSVAKAIANELRITKRNNGYTECGNDIVTWCFGHLLQQATPDAYLPDDIPTNSAGNKIWRIQDLPIFPKKWILISSPETKQQLQIISQLLKKADSVVNAGDPDREGCLLVDEILNYYNYKNPVKRFWASAQDSKSIRKALENLKDNTQFKGWTNAALGRARSDWLVGMNFSRAFTLRAQNQKGKGLPPIYIGRVKSPTMAMVVKRDLEIENFKPKPFYTIQAELKHANGVFVAKWKPAENQQGLDSENRLVDLNIAKAIIAKIGSKNGKITSFKQEQKKKNQPLAFSLSDITALASSRFGYSASDTLEVCQALYETHKLTSYPRTDCPYLPESQHIEAPQVLNALRNVLPKIFDNNFLVVIDKTNPQIKSPTWNDKKITAHHGIIPTMQNRLEKPLNEKEKNIYELIVRAYLAQFYPAYEYLQTAIDSVIENELFTAKGQITIKNGWKDVYNIDTDDKPNKDETESENTTQKLPNAQNGDNVFCQKGIGQTLQTKAPQRFTEGTLIRAMENIHRYVQDPEQKKMLKDGDGIGTSATRAGIIEELKNKNKYLEAKGKNIVSTTLGREVYKILPDTLKSPVLSAIFESALSKIEKGTETLENFTRAQEAYILQNLQILEKNQVKIFANYNPPRQQPTNTAYKKKSTTFKKK